MSRFTLIILLFIPCAILAKCPVCKKDPCKGVSSPHCETEKCGKCRPVCYDKKGGSRLPCYFKNCAKTSRPACAVDACNLIMGQNCVSSCSHCDPICFDGKGHQKVCEYMTF